MNLDKLATAIQKKPLTVAQIAERLKVSRMTIYLALAELSEVEPVLIGDIRQGIRGPRAATYFLPPL